MSEFDDRVSDVIGVEVVDAGGAELCVVPETPDGARSVIVDVYIANPQSEEEVAQLRAEMDFPL